MRDLAERLALWLLDWFAAWLDEGPLYDGEDGG